MSVPVQYITSLIKKNFVSSLVLGAYFKLKEKRDKNFHPRKEKYPTFSKRRSREKIFFLIRLPVPLYLKCHFTIVKEWVENTDPLNEEAVEREL